MKLRYDLPILALAWLKPSEAFFNQGNSFQAQLANLDNLLNDESADGFQNPDGSIQTQGRPGDGRTGSGISSQPYMHHEQQPVVEEINYPPPSNLQNLGTFTSSASRKNNKNSDSTAGGPGGRSGKTSEADDNPISTPQDAIDEAHENDIMILSSDYMYVSNCLLRKRHATDPIRQRAFDLFKQTAAGDWFIVFGYVCGDDWSCWKKNVQNLLSRKGEDYGGGVVGRCVSRLVREKAEGLRTRRRREATRQRHRRNVRAVSVRRQELF